MTGVLSGTPSAVAASQGYLVTATNSGGVAQATLTIAVNDLPPSGLMYATNPAIYTRLTMIPDDAPTSSGGAVASYAIQPQVPDGLSFDTTTGILSGTPTVISVAAPYTVTATNSGGSTQATLHITVNDIAPSSLTYAMNPAVYTNGVAITSNMPTSSGGPVTSYSIGSTLPAGLSFNTSTGVISGTPTALSIQESFTITATNSGGSTSVNLSVTVNDVAPASVAYATNPAVFNVGTAITPDAPSSTGGAVISYAISGTLPAGLSFSTSTGILSGTPTAVAAMTGYTVTATNSGGSATATLTITVAPNNNYSTSGMNGTVSVGVWYACAIVSSGVVCWGDNYYGELGNNSTIDSGVPVEVVGLTAGVQAVAAGDGYTCALVNGGVQCWGGNGGGTLGNNSTVPSSVPVQVQGLTSGVQAITAGAGYACAVVNGGAWCWGFNDVGQLGDDSTVQSNVPVQVTGLTSGVQAISASYHTCALVNGGVWCWGDNGSGQLGNNSSNDSSVPVRVTSLSAGVQAISVSNLKSCAIVNGAMKCWGDNSEGDLGNNSTVNSPIPVQVQGLTSGVQAIATGQGDGVALVNGGLWWWGQSIGSAVPVAVAGASAGVQALAYDDQSGCALVNGAVHCWGYNNSGQLGNNSTTTSASTVQVTGLTGGVEAVVAGWDSTCAIINGGAQCWGDNQYGGLGNNSNSNSSSPVQVVGLTSGVQAIAVGYLHACAIVNGGVMCWGENNAIQLGNNSTNNSSVPVQVKGLTSGATAIVANEDYTCATVNGGAQCWGATPNQAVGSVSGWTSGVQAIATGSNEMCAIVNGSVQCVGNNYDGQLGNGSTVSESTTVVQVTGLTSGAQAVAVGRYSGCASVNGSVQCWGEGQFGGLGNGSSGSSYYSTVPVQVTGLTSGVQSISYGQYGGCALVNGGVQCWGDDAFGELGNNSTAESNVPVPVSGATSGVQAITSGFGSQSCLLSGASVECWGNSADGQLGNGGGNALVPVVVTPWAQ